MHWSSGSPILAACSFSSSSSGFLNFNVAVCGAIATQAELLLEALEPTPDAHTIGEGEGEGEGGEAIICGQMSVK